MWALQWGKPDAPSPLELTSFLAHIFRPRFAQPRVRSSTATALGLRETSGSTLRRGAYLTVGFPCGTAMAEEKSDAAGVRGVGGPPAEIASNGFA